MTSQSPDAAESTEPLAPEPVEAADELTRLKAEVAQSQDRLIRLAADFDNYKKRAGRERDEARRAGMESVIGKLVPVLDNFDMAMSAANQPSTSLESLRTGVNMIHGQFRSLLGELGIVEIDGTGQPFDPSLHDAVSTEPSDEAPEGSVLQQVRKGYKIGDRLLRPASVVVASKPA